MFFKARHYEFGRRTQMKNTTIAKSYAGDYRMPVTVGLLFVMFTVTGRLNAQSRGTEFVPFNRFVEETRTSTGSAAIDGLESRVKDRPALERMRQHILSLYEGVNVTHSFVEDAIHFDCVPVTQQPSARLLGIDSIAEEPPQSLLMGYSNAADDAAEGKPSPASQALSATAVDDFGNSTTCEPQTIPMRRVTLQDMSRFPSPEEFFQKNDVTPAASPTAGHKYSTMYQTVNNLGGGSSLNLWNPVVNTSRGEAMSLSQQWYVGGSGASTQTAEVGWQVMPNTWGTTKAVLFIYWTAADYDQADYPQSKGGGCYNLTCAGFMQTNYTWKLGGTFPSYSTLGGPQYDFTAEYHLYNGNWWLAINGTFIGYFPTSIYRGGQMSKNAQQIQFGTESAGTSVWPEEGSGYWPTSGFGYAAYQRNVFYHDLSGNAIQAALTRNDPSPNCYLTSTELSSTSSVWNKFFYEGGPGGPACQ
jgi:hypothetical protein